MAISAQQRQKKLAKKKQKRKSVGRAATPSMKKAKGYANYPIHECFIPTDLFTSGLGELVVTRRTPSGIIAVSAFVIDVFCLGVKDAMFLLIPEDKYENEYKERMSFHGQREFEKLHQSYAKKLLDGLVEYAKGLGFSPHPDYLNAKDLLIGIDASVCSEKYSYGKDGKPFYMNGPYESESDMMKIINTLTKHCGADGFNTLVRIGDFDDEDEYDDEYEEDDEFLA